MSPPVQRDERLRDVPVLVVDSDPTSQRSLLVVLADAGCNARGAASAEEALTMLYALDPRIVVLDLVLPKLSGLMLAEKLRTHLRAHRVDVIAMSAFDGPAAREMAADAGCVAFLRKPVDAAALMTLVTSLVGDEGAS
jgi:CheY-like chemotaxis protein